MSTTFAEDTTVTVSRVRDLYDRGLYLQAYQAGSAWGALADWPMVDGRILAGRLASHLGAARLANWLMRCTWKAAPDHAEARYYHAYSLWRRRGPYRAWRFVNQFIEPPAETSDEVRASWYGLLGEISGMLRDFDTAEHWLRRADEVAPQSPWVQVCWATVREFEDRYEEALAASQRAMTYRPWYRAAAQSAGHLLTLLGRDDEARELLTEAMQHVESSALAIQLYALQIELKDYAAAGKLLTRFQELSPLLEKESAKWFASQRSEIAYHTGNVPLAIEEAKQTDSEFFKALVVNLEDPARADGKEVILDVPFVRQHHVTCAPATLSALSRYWSMPADHLQVADEICYNGTSNFSERKWARENGWITREFSVTEASTAALIDRGIPFTFTTVDPANSHLQAIIGYDSRRGTVLVRDPFWRNAGEGLASKILERYRAYGPRGMAMVPEVQAEKLASLDLPDAPLWDQVHELDGALTRHKRQQAQEIYDAMLAAAPDHRLTFAVRHRLSIYDGNPTEQLAAVEQLLTVNPDDQALQNERLALMRHQGSREERLQIYKELCAKKECHPIFWQYYAQELRLDARQHSDALWLLSRAIRRWPTEGANYYILANIYTDQRRFDEALELYRFAACLSDKDEQFSQAYYSAAAWFKQSDAVEKFLSDRFERMGKKSGQPAKTLISALMQVNRYHEAMEIAEAAIKLRPEDGDLLLFAADVYLAASSENLPRAMELIEAARDKCPRGQWLRTAARLEYNAGGQHQALAHWREILVMQPLAIDAHRQVARLLAETEGTAAALAHLQAACDRFPHHYPLHELWVEWLADEPASVREPIIRRVVAMMPDDAAMHRDLAYLLAGERRFDEAWAEADIAGRLDPNNPSHPILPAILYRRQDRFEEAKVELRRAIELSVDSDYAIAALVDLCESRAERRAALEFVQQQLVKQVTFGDGLLAFREHARSVLEADELLALLRDALAERPDLWHAWSAVAQQLLSMHLLEDAWATIETANARFPLLQRLWLDRSQICRARHDSAGERAALENALRINPSWNVAVHALCEVYERERDYAKCKELLEQAIVRNPFDAVSFVMLGEMLWRLDDQPGALARVQQAVQLEPGNEQAWDYLNAWSERLECPEKALESARELTERRSGEARSWLVLARMLDAPEQLDERLDAIERCLALNPRCTDAYDLQATSLAYAQRFDEALRVCQPPAFNAHPPMELRARAAWVEYERGDTQLAIDRLRAVVEDEPHFYGAWSKLAEWCQMAQDLPGYLQAAEAMVKISPQYEVCQGIVGEARQMSGDLAGAKEAFTHAFALNPNYEFAGNSLFDLQLEAGELAAARTTLDILLQHSDSALVLGRDVQLAGKTSDRERALAGLQKLCTLAAETRWPLAIAVQTCKEQQWSEQAERILEQALELPDALPDVGRYWVQLATQRGHWQIGQRLQALTAQGEVGVNATHAYVEALYLTGRNAELHHFVRQNGHWLKANDMCWGSVSYSLTGIRDYQAAAAWCADWQGREGAKPWMLVNVAEGFRGTGKLNEAIQVSQHALAMPNDNGSHLHHLWLACDAACAGRIDEAREHLPFVPVEPLDADYEFLNTIVQGLVELADAPPQRAGAVYGEVYRRLQAARKSFPHYNLEPGRRAVYRQAIWQLAKLRGTTSAQFWALAEWLQS